MSDDRLPTSLWIDAQLHQCTLEGTPFYIVNKGAYSSGTVLLKLNSLSDEGCKLLQQQRNLDNEMGWMGLFKGELVQEKEVDDYINRAVGRDPDLWVIEIETRELKNPFEGKIF